MWIFHCWNRLFGGSKLHYKDKVLYSSCSMCHVLTIKITIDKEPVLQWLKNQSKESEICYYWYIIIDLMLNLLIFERSMREGNFSLHVSLLNQVVKWYYTCDHYAYYAFWTTVLLYHLADLPSTSPYLYKCFSDGCFVYDKSDRKFSSMAIQQAHKQNNMVIKGIGGTSFVHNKDD